MPTREAWALAYYRQARSDWAIFQEFQGRTDIPTAQALHYLQMATEKLAKAYRFRDPEVGVKELLTCHVALVSFINGILYSSAFREQYRGKGAMLGAIQRRYNQIARTIESLAPSVDRGNNPENAEYPWLVRSVEPLDEDGDVVIPIDYGFPNLHVLQQRDGLLFLQLIDQAFADFTPV